MTLLESILLHQFAAFVLTLGRVGALVMTIPALSTAAAPMRVRALLAVCLTLLVTPIVGAPTDLNANDLVALTSMLASEVLVGLLLGLGMMILMSGVQLTGELISQLGGTAVAETYDPTIEDNASVFSQLFYFLALAMFLLLDGHRLTMEALLDTFVWLPPGKAALGRSFVEALTTLLSQSFVLGLRAAAPAIVALLLATTLLGLIGRTLPQINVLAIGFSVNAMTTMGILLVSIGGIATAFPQQCGFAVDLLRDAVRAAAELPLKLQSNG